MSLREVIDATTPSTVAKLAHTELPIRYAHRIQQIEDLPGWQTCQDMCVVHELYNQAFRDVRLLELDENFKNLNQFTDVIQTLKKKFQAVIPRLANGMRELEKTQDLSEDMMQEWLDVFLLSRIGTEMLTSQYIATVRGREKRDTGKKRNPGIVDFRCDPAHICEQAAKHAKRLCKQHYRLKEDVNIIVESAGDRNDRSGRIRFSYVPQYLFYIMVELLKNSARATVENTEEEKRLREKPIIITVGADSSQVAIRISDRANGIPFSVRDRVWSYMYSTASKGKGATFVQEGTPLAGYGVGLPLSRLYARYLGGHLSLMSLPGFGTNAYLYLKRIEEETFEEVPDMSSLSSLGALASL